MKLRPPFIAAVAAAVLLTGVAGADPPMTKPEAKRLAQSLVLVDADMPDYTPSRHVITREDRQAVERWLKCAGAVSRTRELAAVYSHDFEATDRVTGAEGAIVVSSATVQPSMALARHDLAALRRSRKCERKYGIVTTPDLGSSSQVFVKDRPEPAPGVWSQRITFRSTDFSGHTARYCFDLLWFRRGSTEILLATATSDQPFPAAEEQRLLNLLLTRAQQQIP